MGDSTSAMEWVSHRTGHPLERADATLSHNLDLGLSTVSERSLCCAHRDDKGWMIDLPMPYTPNANLIHRQDNKYSSASNSDSTMLSASGGLTGHVSIIRRKGARTGHLDSGSGGVNTPLLFNLIGDKAVQVSQASLRSTVFSCVKRDK